MNITKVLAENLRKARNAKGLTQQALADSIKVNVQTIRDIEAGRRNPSLPTLEDLAGKLAIKVSSLFLEDNQPSKEPIQISVTEAIRRFQSVPPDVYEMAIKLGPESEAWESVKVILKRVIIEVEEDEKKRGHSIA